MAKHTRNMSIKLENRLRYGTVSASKSWVCIGNIFMKLPDSNIQEMLHQG